MQNISSIKGKSHIDLRTQSVIMTLGVGEGEGGLSLMTF